MPVPGIDRGGLLHVRGPNVMSGYLRYENPGVLEPPASELGAGWYNTGDVVEIDADGFVTILGRVKRFAKVAGEMISLEVVEKIALAASPVAQHAASSQPDEQRGEAIVLFTTDDALTRERLQEAARAGGHPEIAVPRKIVKLDGVPAARHRQGRLREAEGAGGGGVRARVRASDRRAIAGAGFGQGGHVEARPAWFCPARML